jgi:hypothetical protein
MAGNEEAEDPKSLSDFGYTAFERWDYKPIIYKLDHDQSWIDMAQSFYRGGHGLIGGVVEGDLREDVEGVAGVFLFRHYLELVLKRIVLRGRWLKKEDKNAARESVKEVANIHELGVLWRWVLEDARPKVSDDTWKNYDVGFVERCIAEFDAVDKKGFAFRYPGQGGEYCRFDYEYLYVAMEHVEQILGNMLTYLIESYAENAEYDAILESEYGADIY